MSKLLDAFMSTIGKTDSKIVDVPGIGRVGVRTSMSLEDRAKYFRSQKKETANAQLLQITVFDPESEELIFKKISLEDINRLSAHVLDPLICEALKALNMPKTEPKEPGQEQESEQLKNSDNDPT